MSTLGDKPSDWGWMKAQQHNKHVLLITCFDFGGSMVDVSSSSRPGTAALDSSSTSQYTASVVETSVGFISGLTSTDAALRPHEIVGGASKRCLDFLAALLLLPFLTPLLLLISLAVFLERAGPIMFRQRRGGLHGKTFVIYKFRTMKVLEDGHLVKQVHRGDWRVTKLGAFLRKTSLDELPQILNVLLGDMSFVGPRPHAIAHDQAFSDVAPGYSRRFAARPGITGLAQVSGSRGPTETPDSVRGRLELDLKYVDQWSLWLDVKIIWRTVFCVFGDRRAF